MEGNILKTIGVTQILIKADKLIPNDNSLTL